MKKLLFIITVLVLVLSFSGCSQKPKDSNKAVVIEQGSDIEGVSIEFKRINLKAEKPYIEIEWKNDTENEFVYGESFELEYLHGTEYKSCVKDEVYFNALGYILPANSSQTEEYYLSQFDLSKYGTYKFKVRYGESKYLWIVFELIEEEK